MTSKKTRDQQRKETHCYVQLWVPKRKAARWKQLAGSDPLSRFIRDAVDDYVERLDETTERAPESDQHQGPRVQA
jgi:hypothetical protein